LTKYFGNNYDGITLWYQKENDAPEDILTAFFQTLHEIMDGISIVSRGCSIDYRKMPKKLAIVTF
jgi:hypothetical protein